MVPVACGLTMPESKPTPLLFIVSTVSCGGMSAGQKEQKMTPLNNPALSDFRAGSREHRPVGTSPGGVRRIRHACEKLVRLSHRNRGNEHFVHLNRAGRKKSRNTTC